MLDLVPREDAESELASTADRIAAEREQVREEAKGLAAQRADVCQRGADYKAKAGAGENQLAERMNHYIRDLVGGAGGKRPSQHGPTELEKAAVTAGFEEAKETLSRCIEKGHSLDGRGGTLELFPELCDGLMKITRILELNEPLIARVQELREEIGLPAQHAWPVLRQSTLDAYMPFFQSWLGSRHGPIDGNTLSLNFLGRCGVDVSGFVDQLDSGKKDTRLASGLGGGDRFIDLVEAWESEVADFLRGDVR